MANRITEEQKIQINEVYAQCGVKSKTAEIVGVSVASVSRYLIPNYVPAAQRNLPECIETPLGYTDFVEKIIATIDSAYCSPVQAFCKVCELTDDEWDELKELQKGLII